MEFENKCFKECGLRMRLRSFLPNRLSIDDRSVESKFLNRYFVGNLIVNCNLQDGDFM